MDAEVTTMVGLKGKHDAERTAVRHGPEPGSGHPWRAAGADAPPAGTDRRR
jgi:hypothetical protein